MKLKKSFINVESALLSFDLLVVLICFLMDEGKHLIKRMDNARSYGLFQLKSLTSAFRKRFAFDKRKDLLKVFFVKKCRVMLRLHS